MNLFQVVEFALVAAYLAAIRRHPFRLALSLAVVVSAVGGFMIDVFFRALRPNSFYAGATAPLEWFAASATAAAVAGAAVGNILARRPRAAYIPAMALLVGSAIGVLYAPLLLPAGSRLLRIEAFSVRPSRPFTVSELGYLLGVAWGSLLYVERRVQGGIDRLVERRARLRERQLGVAREYVSRVRVGPVEVVDREWEKSVLGSGLAVRREGRSYTGVPTVEHAERAVRRVAALRIALLAAARLAILAGLLALLGSRLWS